MTTGLCREIQRDNSDTMKLSTAYKETILASRGICQLPYLLGKSLCQCSELQERALKGCCRTSRTQGIPSLPHPSLIALEKREPLLRLDCCFLSRAFPLECPPKPSLIIFKCPIPLPRIATTTSTKESPCFIGMNILEFQHKLI